MDFVLEALVWFLGELLWQLFAGIILEAIFLFVDTVWVRRRALPETWSRIQIVAAVLAGPPAGALSAIVAPRRAAGTLAARVLAWLVLPLAGGAAMALMNGAVARQDPSAARRLGWLCGALFGLGYLVGRRLVLGPLP